MSINRNAPEFLFVLKVLDERIGKYRTEMESESASTETMLKARAKLAATKSIRDEITKENDDAT